MTHREDSQVYGFCRLDEMQSIATQFIEVRIFLMLLLTQGEKLDCSAFIIDTDAAEPKSEVRDLGHFLARDLSMTSHVTGLMRTSFSILRQLRSVSRSLTQDVTRQLVQSLILRRIDFCNVAFAGLL